MVDILIVVCIVIFIFAWLANVADILSWGKDNKKIDIHIHNHPVKTTKIIDSYIEKDGQTHIYHEEAEEEGHK